MSLEARYRRLLLVLPTEHRVAYGDEMLEVMLAGAEPGQRRPSPRETADLVRTAVWMRVGQVFSRVTDGRWRGVAAVFAVISTMMLAAEHLRPFVGDASIGRAIVWDDVDGWSRIAQASGWLLAAGCVLIGWRVAAVVAGWLAVAAEAAWLASQWPLWQADVVAAWWQWILAVTCAITLSVRTVRGHGIRLLGAKRVAWLGALSGLVAVSMFMDSLVHLRGIPERVGPGPWPWIDVVGAALLGGYGLTLLVSLAAVDGWLRRRVLVLLAPPLAMLALAGSQVGNPLLAGGEALPQTVATLLILPLAVIVSALVMVHRRERRMVLLRLGRQAELAKAAQD